MTVPAVEFPTTLERGFREFVVVLSLVALASGLLFTALLGTALALSVYFDRQRQALLLGEGCPAETDLLPPRDAPAVTRLGPDRWQALVPRPGYTAAYVVTAGRKLSEKEVLAAAAAPFNEIDLLTDIIHRRPSPDVAVLDCLFRSSDLSRAQRETPSNRFIAWWRGQLVRLHVMGPRLLGKGPGLVFVPATLLPALLLTAVAAILPWALYRPVRSFVGDLQERLSRSRGERLIARLDELARLEARNGNEEEEEEAELTAPAASGPARLAASHRRG